jgi:hypothetical protein
VWNPPPTQLRSLVHARTLLAIVQLNDLTKTLFNSVI